jgi:hypothetical protein
MEKNRREIMMEELRKQTEIEGKYVGCIFCSVGHYRKNNEVEKYERVLGKDKYICPSCLNTLVDLLEKWGLI